MIKVRDIAFVRFAAPDLEKMRGFLSDFGLETYRGPDDRIYARGTDTSPYLHVTEEGEAGFCGVAFEAGSAEELAAASKLPGASKVQKLDAPGGGQCVQFHDPDGNLVEVVYGREPLPRLPIRGASPINRGSEQLRHGALQRVPAGPACVKRLGHVVLRVSDFRASADWYQSHFGFVASDEVYLGEQENLVTAFFRCDLGSEYTDHHTFLCVGLGEPGFDHAAFEVEDIDSVFAGHDHLLKQDYEHHAGIGRHILGGQIFDYWRDPWGSVLEHFTDGDLLNDQHETGLQDPAAALGTQWGKFA